MRSSTTHTRSGAKVRQKLAQVSAPSCGRLCRQCACRCALLALLTLLICIEEVKGGRATLAAAVVMHAARPAAIHACVGTIKMTERKEKFHAVIKNKMNAKTANKIWRFTNCRVAPCMQLVRTTISFRRGAIIDLSKGTTAQLEKCFVFFRRQMRSASNGRASEYLVERSGRKQDIC